jgi:hypothetical protein
MEARGPWYRAPMTHRAVVLGPAWLACLLATTAARADELGPGEKGVRTTLLVHAAPPNNKALILHNTFRGADVVTPETEGPISWHPARGDMEIVMVAASEAAKLPALHEAGDRDAVARISAAGVRCGGAFAGLRTLPVTSPAETVRWTFNVKFNKGGCAAEKVGVEYLDAGGHTVDPGAVTREPPITPPDLEAVKVPEKAAEPAKANAAGPPATSGGCNARGAGDGAGLLLVVGLLLRRRR